MSLRKRLAAALAVIGIACLVTFLQVEANHETNDQISNEAVWIAGSGDLSAIDQACKNAPANEYTACFIDQMGGYASSDAVAFSELLASQKSPRLGYLAGIRESGVVDLGYVVYPVDAKPRRGWVLMNGIPAVVNVDNLSVLPIAEMEKNAQYGTLRRDHPQLQLAVVDKQRDSESSPQVDPLAEGGQRFVIPYSLKEDCAGCAPIAKASFGFDFDAAGRFLGVKFLSIESLHQ